MDAPNRSSEVAAICQENLNLFTGDDGRRELLKIICRTLNAQDGGNWGLLLKKDRQPPFVPADTIVWWPTREHFDVLTDAGPFWNPNGPLPNDSWVWLAVEGSPGPAAVQPADPQVLPVPPETTTGFAKQLTALQTEVAALRDVVLASQVMISQILVAVKERKK